MVFAKKVLFPFYAAALFFFTSCYKKDIQFGTDLGETFTNLTQIDTVAVSMSTVVLDSFATNSPSSFLVGSYKDPYLGLITAKPFFQLSLPSDVSIATDAVYDSLVFMVKLNGNYYGDTTKAQTLTVHELAQSINYTYGTQLYNTSNFDMNPVILGSKTVKVSPATDSVRVRLSDAKGAELFNKLKTAATEVATSTDFLNYFKGIALSFGESDSSLVYGIDAAADSVKMRLYYHSTAPYPASAYKDFTLNDNDLAFNQLISDRSGTVLQSSGTGIKEFASTVTGNQSYMQSSAGVLLKITFPTLRDVLQLSSTVKLISATLVVRAAANSSDAYKFRLPANLYLANTDASNNINSLVYDAAGTSAIYSAPESDYIYNTNASYSFTITSEINSLLTTSGSSASGFYLLENYPGTLSPFSRLIANDAHHDDLSTQLILSVLTIKND